MAEENEVVYGKGLPTVLEPFMGPIDQIADKIKYRSQLIARDQKLSSGVNASTPVGLAIGFLVAMLMMLVPMVLSM